MSNINSSKKKKTAIGTNKIYLITYKPVDLNLYPIYNSNVQMYNQVLNNIVYDVNYP